MINAAKDRKVRWAVCFLIVLAVIASVVMSASASRRDVPKLVYSAFDSTTGTAVVLLTNASSRSWSFPLHIVQGLPRPSYWIVPERGPPGWFPEYEEGIRGAEWTYTRDSSGRYYPAEPIRSGQRVTVAFSNVVLRPQQFLSFSVPVRDIRGLSKVGVKYHRPPPSSRLGRTAVEMRDRVRALLHLKPATHFEEWCETSIPTPPNAR